MRFLFSNSIANTGSQFIKVFVWLKIIRWTYKQLRNLFDHRYLIFEQPHRTIHWFYIASKFRQILCIVRALCPLVNKLIVRLHESQMMIYLEFLALSNVNTTHLTWENTDSTPKNMQIKAKKYEPRIFDIFCAGVYLTDWIVF